MKTILKVNGTNGTFALVKDNSEWDEYIVQLWEKGVHVVEADYHTSDKDDAEGTALMMIGEYA